MQDSQPSEPTQALANSEPESIRQEYSATKLAEAQDIKPLTEQQRLEFAIKVLLWLMGFSIFSIALSAGLVIWASHPKPGDCASCNSDLVEFAKAIFDLAKTVIPSMVTLVLGFYFGRKDT
jgi:hypothetical protein